MTLQKNPTPLEIAERFRFHKRNQKEGESVGDFVAGIRKLSTHCNIGEFQENMLRHRQMCGLQSEHIQNKLLAQADLTFSKALSMAFAIETAYKDASELDAKASDVHNLSHLRKMAPSQKEPCYRCLGKFHEQSECYFKETIYRKCKQNRSRSTSM